MYQFVGELFNALILVVFGGVLFFKYKKQVFGIVIIIIGICFSFYALWDNKSSETEVKQIKSMQYEQKDSLEIVKQYKDNLNYLYINSDSLTKDSSILVLDCLIDLPSGVRICEFSDEIVFVLKENNVEHHFAIKQEIIEKDFTEWIQSNLDVLSIGYVSNYVFSKNQKKYCKNIIIHEFKKQLNVIQVSQGVIVFVQKKSAFLRLTIEQIGESNYEQLDVFQEKLFQCLCD